MAISDGRGLSYRLAQAVEEAWERLGAAPPLEYGVVGQAHCSEVVRRAPPPRLDTHVELADRHPIQLVEVGLRYLGVRPLEMVPAVRRVQHPGRVDGHRS